MGISGRSRCGNVQIGVVQACIPLTRPTTTSVHPHSRVLSEGDKRDSKGNMPERARMACPILFILAAIAGRSYFAPEPASRTRPRRTLPTLTRRLFHVRKTTYPGWNRCGSPPEAWAREVEDERLEIGHAQMSRVPQYSEPGAGAGRVSHALTRSRVRPSCHEGPRLGCLRMEFRADATAMPHLAVAVWAHFWILSWKFQKSYQKRTYKKTIKLTMEVAGGEFISKLGCRFGFSCLYIAG
ncbi:hypothetical protein GGR52DRAFT_317043 [Hypoxylon sp. FL1284]|nr:hypothetical protein GGR52DRAFT_317043 [Hypoxylon sp. FL1284]